MSTNRFDIDHVKRAARGRWVEILSRLGGLDREILDGKHGPCPRCKGTDRFRAFDDVAESGGVFCNKCHAQENGDGFSTLQWLQGWDFAGALQKVAEYLNVAPSTNGHSGNGKTKDATPLNEKVEWSGNGKTILAAILPAWCATKPPIKPEAVTTIGAKFCRWPKGPSAHRCLALEGRRIDGAAADLSAILLYSLDAPEFPAFGSLSSRKTHLVGGSVESWIWAGTVETLKSAAAVVKVEGPSDLLAVLSVGLPTGWVAITNVCGAKSANPKKLDFSWVAGKQVFIVGDADEPGQDGARRFAAAFHQAGASEVRLVALPYEVTPDHGKDLRDWFNEGHAGADFAALAEAAPAGYKSQPRDEQPWGEVEPFDSFDLPAFPVDCLPSTLREWVKAEAITTQTPTDLSAMLALAMVAAPCAKRVEVDVRPGWCEPVNIYVLVVLPPAERKSVVFAHVTEPLREYERELAERVAPKVREYAIEARALEGRLKEIERKASKVESAEDRKRYLADAKAVAMELACLAPVATPRLIADDCTAERLTGLMVEQGGRITVAAPEGTVFDLMRGAYSKAGMPIFDVYLKGHSGDEIRVDRVSRPAEFISKPAITLAMAVQPDVVRGMFGVDSFRGRGLLGRILYSIPISTLGTRMIDPPPMPESVAENYRATIKGLCCLPPNVDENGQQTPYRLTLTSEAREVLHRAMARVEPHLGPGGQYEHCRDWAGKLIGAELRLAGLVHMAANVTHWEPWNLPISGDSMQAAVTIGSYLSEHAMAAYALMGTVAEANDAEHVFKWILRRGGEKFTKRDAWQVMKRRFARAEMLDAPLTELMRRNIIRPTKTSEQGRPGRPASQRYEVNPEVITQPSRGNCGDCGGAFKQV